MIRTDSAEVMQPLHENFYSVSPVRELVWCEEKGTLPARQTIVQTYFGGLEFLRAAAASARACTLSYLVVGTTGVDSNLGLHDCRVISAQEDCRDDEQ